MSGKASEETGPSPLQSKGGRYLNVPILARPSGQNKGPLFDIIPLLRHILRDSFRCPSRHDPHPPTPGKEPPPP